MSIFKRHATKRIRVSQNGVSKTLSVAEAIIEKNYQAAIKGDQTAMANMYKLAELAGELQDWNDAKVVGRPIFMPEPCGDLDDLLAEMGASRVKVGSQTAD